MQKLAGIIISFVMLAGCNTVESSPREFVEENRALLDSCTTFILQNTDALFSSDLSGNTMVISIHVRGSMHQSEFADSSPLIQRLLATEIDYISLDNDSTIIYYIEGSDRQSNRYMIVYSRSQTSEELRSRNYFIEPPKQIEGYYYAAADNISIAN